MKQGKPCSLKVLFWTFFKIGLFTFGGGYAMMAMMEEELVKRRQWISSEDMLEIVGLSESTPGPVAINSATILGYRLYGVIGSITCTVAEILPAFCIMYVISLFLNQFMNLPIVSAAFNGIQCGVAVLIARAGISLFKKLKKDWKTIFIFAVSTCLLLCIHIFNWNFSSLLLIIMGAVFGLIFSAIPTKKKEEKQ